MASPNDPKFLHESGSAGAATPPARPSPAPLHENHAASGFVSINAMTNDLSRFLVALAITAAGTSALPAFAEDALEQEFSIHDVASATTVDVTGFISDPLPLRWTAAHEVWVGDPAPLFQLVELGKRNLIYLSSYRGSRLALYVTAPWIPQASPLLELDRFERQHGDSGHHALGVSVGTDPGARLQPVLDALEITDLPFVVDPMLTVPQTYGIRDLPALLLIDEHGTIARRYERLRAEAFPRALEEIRAWLPKPLEPDPGLREGRLAPRQRWRSLEYKVKRNEKDPALREEIAIAFYDAGLPHRALNQFEVMEALQLYRNDPVLRWRLGVVYDALGDRGQALAHWRSAASDLHAVPLIQTALRVAENPALCERLRRGVEDSILLTGEGS